MKLVLDKEDKQFLVVFGIAILFMVALNWWYHGRDKNLVGKIQLTGLAAHHEKTVREEIELSH